MASNSNESTQTSDGQIARLDAFYSTDEPRLSPAMKTILTEYSHIPEDQLIAHVTAIRDKAWAHFKYPCIGTFSFLNLSIAHDPEYPHVLQQLLRADVEAKLLDVGCCFGQDLRKLVVDGVDARRLAGTDFQAGFLDLGYELFRDREGWEGRFEAGDWFAEGNLGVEEGGILKPAQYDFLHCASFFHLFSREEQVVALTKAVRLLKPQAGSKVFGHQIGSAAGPKVVQMEAFRSGEAYRHSAASWAELVQEVAGITGMRLEVKGEFTDRKFEDRDGRRLNWEIYFYCMTVV